MRIDEAEKDKADAGLATGQGQVRPCLHEGHGRVRGERLLGLGADSLQAVLRVRGDARRLRRRAAVADLAARRLRAADRRDHRGAGPRARGDERGDAAARTGRPSSARGSRRPATSTSATSPRTGCGPTGSPPCSRQRGIRMLRPRRPSVAGGNAREDAERGGRGGQPHDRHPVGRLHAVAAGPGRLGRDGGGGPGRHQPTAHPGQGRRDPAGAAVLRADGGGPDPARREPGDRGAAQGARLPAEARPTRLAGAVAEPRYPRTIPPVWRVPTQERRPSPAATRSSRNCTTS